MEIKGTLKKTDLEGGVWVFVGDDGRQYSLNRLNSSLKKDGARLAVTGTEKQAFGFAMVGPTIDVESAKEI